MPSRNSKATSSISETNVIASYLFGILDLQSLMNSVIGHLAPISTNKLTRFPCRVLLTRTCQTRIGTHHCDSPHIFHFPRTLVSSLSHSLRVLVLQASQNKFLVSEQKTTALSYNFPDQKWGNAKTEGKTGVLCVHEFVF
jgi:hypothetical protein